MTDNTTRLDLPYILPSQAQKHVTHNEALRARCARRRLRFRLGRACRAVRPGGGRVPCGRTVGRRRFCRAHGRNRRLCRRRLALNKAGAAGTASVLFQTGYSGRAEFGLAGSDAFSVKVSPDGATWNSSFSVVPADGRVRLEAPLDGNGHALGNLSNLVVGGTSAIQATTLYGNAVVKDGSFFVQRDTWGRVDTTVAADAANGSVTVRRRRGTIASSAAVRAGDVLGNFNCYGYDGVSDVQVLYLTGMAGNDFDVAKSAYWRIAVTNNGSYLEVQRWTPGGDVGIGTGAPTTKLHVDGLVRVKSYPAAGLPDAASNGEGAIVYVSDESGGPVLAFSDGTDWRRVTDRAVVN